MLKKNIAITIMLCVILLISSSQVFVNAKDTKSRKIVIFKSYVSKDRFEKILSNISGYRVKTLENINGVVAYLPNNSKAVTNQHPDIMYIEDDMEVNLFGKQPSPTTTPTQPNQVLTWGIDTIDAEKTFSAVDTRYVKIGIIDTGIDSTHPDLSQNIKGGYNTISSKGSFNDDNGHGTHVAGIIAAAHNTIGVVGVAPKANIYAVKAFNSSGTGYLSDIIEGISWCIKNGINVINISFGANSNSELLHDVILRAHQAGIVIIAAAGNDSTSTVSYPAAYPEVISVSAVDSNNNIAGFAPIGKIDVVAPGINIYSTMKGSMYGALSGSSMAAPHVAGEAVLLLSTPSRVDTDGDGLCSPNEVKEQIESTSVDLGVLGKDNIYGAGLINVYAATNE